MKEKSKIRHFHYGNLINIYHFPYGDKLNTTIFVFGTIFLHIYPFTSLLNLNDITSNMRPFVFVIIFLSFIDTIIYKKAFKSNYVSEILVNLESQTIELDYFYYKKPNKKICLSLKEIKIIEKKSLSALPSTVAWTAFRIININDNKEYIVSTDLWDYSVYNVLLSFLKSELKKL
ncbi:MAG: hypothetical protein NTW25_09235 [Candidatus Kapabacteria bacterium]|nr:hypothetical protein [Candidatus Kapabacteria bacterium]